MTGGRWVVPVVSALIVIALDQVSKAVVLDTLGEGAGPRSWYLIWDWLGFSYVENRGAAFGTFVGYGAILSVVAIGVIIGAGVLYSRVPRPTGPLATGLGLVVGGAIGNVIDRFQHGFVVDFIAVGTFPRFNVADSAITIGVLLLAWRLGWADEAGDQRPAPVHDATHVTTPAASMPRPDEKDR